MNPIPNLDNTVLMTVNDLVDLQERAEAAPPKYTVGDATVAVIGATIVGGMLYAACLGLKSDLDSSKARTAAIQADIDELNREIAELTKKAGN